MTGAALAPLNVAGVSVPFVAEMVVFVLAGGVLAYLSLIHEDFESDTMANVVIALQVLVAAYLSYVSMGYLLTLVDISLFDVPLVVDAIVVVLFTGVIVALAYDPDEREPGPLMSLGAVLLFLSAYLAYVWPDMNVRERFIHSSFFLMDIGAASAEQQVLAGVFVFGIVGISLAYLTLIRNEFETGLILKAGTVLMLTFAVLSYFWQYRPWPT